MPKRELTEEEVALRIGLGAAIRVASGKRKLKPGDLAAAAGVALSQQYRIENGEVTADFLYLVKITRLLDISLDELLQAAWDEVGPVAPDARVLQSGITSSQPGGGMQQVFNSPIHGPVAGRDVFISGTKGKRR